MPPRYNLNNLPPLPRAFNWNRPLRVLALELDCSIQTALNFRRLRLGRVTEFRGKPKKKNPL